MTLKKKASGRTPVVRVVEEVINDGVLNGYVLSVSGHEYHARFNVRSDLGSSIEKYWVGRKSTNIGMQYLDLKKGMIVKSRYLAERTDILCVQGEQINTFVEVDGDVSVQPWSTREATAAAKRRAELAARKAFDLAKKAGYIDNEAKFFLDKPWTLCHGKTPAQAVQTLQPYEWGRDTKSLTDRNSRVLRVRVLSDLPDEELVALVDRSLTEHDAILEVQVAS